VPPSPANHCLLGRAGIGQDRDAVVLRCRARPCTSRCRRRREIEADIPLATVARDPGRLPVLWGVCGTACVAHV
jgi:hypothetical protein